MKHLLLASSLLLVLVGCSGRWQPTGFSVAASSKRAEPDQTRVSASPSGGLVRLAGVPNGRTSALGLTLPEGFRVNVFARGLKGPRRLAVVPSPKGRRGYDVVVSQSYLDNVVLLHDADGNGSCDSRSTLLAGLNRPYGIEFGNGFIYVANTDAIWRYHFTPGQTRVNSAGQRIAALPTGGLKNHWTRNLLFDKTKRRLFVTVGSSCDACEERSSERAAILEMNADGRGRHVVANGLRNPVGMAWNPTTQGLWTIVNERNELGRDNPPDYLTSVAPRRFYGWPYAYTDINRKVVPAPKFGAKAPRKAAQTYRADVPLQAHSAALGVAFYPPESTQFPPEFRGDVFLAYHGSSVRSPKTGYKIVRVHFEKGRPISVSDFVVGFLKANGSNWGRPVDIQVAPDGSLLFSDDQGGKIWRVSYVGKR